MACKFICDGCGKEQEVSRYPGGWFKPQHWYEKTDRDTGKTYVACCRDCIATIAEKTGTSKVVLPI